MTEPRLKLLVAQDTGYDVDGLLRALEELPRRVYALRQRVAPLKAELAMLKARYDSKGRSPSHFDLQRSLLLSELKEEARDAYERDPKYRTDSRGRQTKIELTDGRAEDLAHASLRYRKFLEEAEADWRRIGELGKEISQLWDKIESWRGRQSYLIQALEMSRAHVYAWSAEARIADR